MMSYPHLYIKGNVVTPAITKRIFNKYNHLLKWKNKESILDIGAGNGKTFETVFLPALPNDYEKLVLTDVSKPMVQYMKENVKVPRLDVRVQDISSENVNSEFLNRFDHIFSSFVLHRVTNVRQSFKNIYLMLKPGGQTFLTFLERDPIGPAIKKLMNHPKWQKYYSGHSISAYYDSNSPKEEFNKDLYEAGFRNFRFETEDHSYQFEDDELWKTLYVAVNTPLPTIPQEDLEEYKKDYLEQCEKTPDLIFSEINGKRIATMHLKMLTFLATKS